MSRPQNEMLDEEKRTTKNGFWDTYGVICFSSSVALERLGWLSVL